jgi:methylenetetrahydrofolate reductase (NADPH)
MPSVRTGCIVGAIPTIPEILARSDRPVFSFEFFPPKSPVGTENLNRALDDLRVLAPDFVSVTYGAGGSTRDVTIDIVDHIKRDLGLEVMAHLTCVNATVDDVRATLDRMRAVGIDNVLALRGDPPRGQERWTKTEGGLEYSHELVSLIRDEYDFTVAGAAFPETHIHAVSAEDDLRHLKRKVDLGVEVLITQMFFDNAYYFDFVERARDAGIDVPIIPGVMPILSFDGLKRMATLSAAEVPALLESELTRRRDDEQAIGELGVSYATLQCADLLAGGAPGIHFITLNRSSATRAILSALRLMEPWTDRWRRAPARLDPETR